MRLAFYTVCLSPHQMPLARELVKRIGPDNFRYISDQPMSAGRQKMGWAVRSEPWCISFADNPKESEEWCRNADFLFSYLRNCDVFERREKMGLKTLYSAERWFKPISIGVGQRSRCSAPGWLRMFVPSYRKMAKRFVRWMNSDSNARCLTIGPWAKKDMLRIGVDESKIVPWGYFVAPSDHKTNFHCQPQPSTTTLSPLRVLWVGRMVHLKRVDTIVRAVAEVEKRGGGGQRKIQLTLVGDGPEKKRLQRLAARMLRKGNDSTVNLQPQPDTITFLPSQPIDKIREIMRSHDVYVLPSNAEEGWGAALSEALEEGMVAIGTYEAGSSATILNEDWRFHAGDWRRLATLLERCREMKSAGKLFGQGIGVWAAKKAAERIVAFATE